VKPQIFILVPVLVAALATTAAFAQSETGRDEPATTLSRVTEPVGHRWAEVDPVIHKRWPAASRQLSLCFLSQGGEAAVESYARPQRIRDSLQKGAPLFRDGHGLLDEHRLSRSCALHEPSDVLVVPPREEHQPDARVSK